MAAIALALAVHGPTAPPSPPDAFADARPARTGEAIYAAKCAQCHGSSGRGDGPAAALLTPRPRDFSTGDYTIRTTASGSLPTGADLLRTVARGLPGTAMPAWKPFLSDDELVAVVAYVQRFTPRFTTEHPTALALGPAVPSSPASIASGRLAYARLGCPACHGEDGAGAAAVATALENAAGRATTATNLTEPWTFRGGASPRDVYLRLRTGMNGTPMPSFDGAARDDELWDVANYVASLARKPAWEMNAAELAAHDAREKRRTAEHPAERGRYLVATLRCAFCHTPLRSDGSLVEPLLFAGGQRRRFESLGEFVAGNLTSDRATGLGAWSDAEIAAALTRGTRPDGSRLRPYAMPWPSYAQLTPDDLHAIVVYLRTLPPIVNAIPPPRRPAFGAYLRSKVATALWRHDPPEYVYPGNAGSAPLPDDDVAGVASAEAHR